MADTVQSLVNQSKSKKVERFNSMLTGWVEKDWDVLDLGCGVGETSLYLKGLGCRPIAVTNISSASKYIKRKDVTMDVRYTDDFTDFLNSLEMPVDCITIRTLLLDGDESAVERTLKGVSERLDAEGVLILNKRKELPITTIDEALPDFYCEYSTDYRTDTRDTFTFMVYKKRVVE